MLIDTHAHLYESSFRADLDEVLTRARNKGVGKIFLPNVDAETASDLDDLCTRHPGFLYGMMGLHPCSVKENYREELESIFERFGANTYYAVGEIGIDLYWDTTFFAQQRDAFAFQLHKSMELDLPVAIHCRNAFDEIFEVVSSPEFSEVRGIFHCFTGTAEQAARLVNLGYFLGIGGVCTFKNGGLDVALQDIGLEHLVLETDAPYLAPVPYRGKRNESSYLSEICQRLADIKHTSPAKVAEITSANAEKLFLKS
jgi:TatD DNase family protein